VSHQQINLLLRYFASKWHEDIGIAQVSLVLKNFVFEDQVLSERIPCDFGKSSVILVQIFSAMGEDDIRLYRFGQFVHRLFDLNNARGKERILKIEKVNVAVVVPIAPSMKSVACLDFARGIATHHDPVKPYARIAFQEAKNRSSATDFDIVWVRTDA